MTQATLDLDPQVLEDLENLQRELGLSMDRLVSTLLKDALNQRRSTRAQPAQAFEWHTSPGGLLIDLSDKDALYDILDRDELASTR
jgi:hypothetical protein